MMSEGPPLIHPSRVKELTVVSDPTENQDEAEAEEEDDGKANFLHLNLLHQQNLSRIILQ